MEDKKVIWITGASSGIGKALSIKFANEGWIVAASARRDNLLEELNHISKNIHSFPLDVTEIDKCKIVAKNIIDQFGDINVCVFGTGMHDPKSEKVFNLDKIRKIMEVNYFGTMNSINSIYGYFSEKKNGQISIISSVAGYRGLPAAGAYCASKAGLLGLTRAVALEGADRGVTCTAVSPTWVETEMLQNSIKKMAEQSGKTPESQKEEIAAANPQHRLVQPQEIAELVSFLCSDLSPALTMEDIQVNAGAHW